MPSELLVAGVGDTCPSNAWDEQGSKAARQQQQQQVPHGVRKGTTSSMIYAGLLPRTQTRGSEPTRMDGQTHACID